MEFPGVDRGTSSNFSYGTKKLFSIFLYSRKFRLLVAPLVSGCETVVPLIVISAILRPKMEENVSHQNLKILSNIKDSFITQDRNDDFEGGQVESTFS